MPFAALRALPRAVIARVLYPAEITHLAAHVALWTFSAPLPPTLFDPPYLVMTDGPAQELRRAVARSLDAELLKPVTQRVWMNIQNLRCALGAINYSIGKLKRSQDMLSV
jgi:hypothetical protein